MEKIKLIAKLLCLKKMKKSETFGSKRVEKGEKGEEMKIGEEIDHV